MVERLHKIGGRMFCLLQAEINYVLYLVAIYIHFVSFPLKKKTLKKDIQIYFLLVLIYIHFMVYIDFWEILQLEECAF